MGDGKSHNGFTSILVRAAILALLYPILKSVWEGWSAFAGKFPGAGVVPYLSSAVVFFATFFILGWVLGTAPVRWFKKGFANLWRYFVLKRFSALEEGAGGGSWRGREMLYAVRGRFGPRERAEVFKCGVITADDGEYVTILIVTPPGGTCEWFTQRKGSDLLWPTNRPIQEHAKTFLTFGNGVDFKKLLPEEGQP